MSGELREDAPSGPASVDLVRVDRVRVTYRLPPGARDGSRATVDALDGVTLGLGEGDSVGLVGESGCGKSTLALTLCRLVAPASGRILHRGEDVTRAPPTRLRDLRREVQIVFQDPLEALDPRWKAGASVEEGLTIHGIGRSRADRRSLALEAMERCGLVPADADRYPHELSGGQRQRVGIARAMALRPRLLLLDEPLSALDVSVASRVLELLDRLRAESGLGYLFISHDLTVVEALCDRVVVMYQGRVVEEGPVESVTRSPLHPYSRLLLDSVPRLGRRRRQRTEARAPYAPPSGSLQQTGCRFAPRCARASDLCSGEEPGLSAPGERRVACHHPVDPPATPDTLDTPTAPNTP